MTLARRVMLSLLLVAGSAAAAEPATSLRHVAKGVTSESAASNAFMVLRNADDLAAALKQIGSRAAAAGGSGDVGAGVDFDREIVLAVVLSNRPTGCAGVDITAIAQDGIVSVVHYRERQPAKGQACDETLYSPFDFVATPKSNAPFRFTRDDPP
ncbi:MAG TPA: hypothetical protein VIP05_01310 [Burkholderiaceae bacterium]